MDEVDIMIIRTENVSKQFKHIKAVDQVTVSIEKGKFYGILGRSGSGKTTLLSLLGLLDAPTEGKLYIDEQEVGKLSSHQKAQIRMKKMGFVFQDFHLNPTMKAYENVMLPMLINPEIQKKDMRERAVALLTTFGLEERIDHLPSQLSGGEKQRVALARALANNPDVILADEPTGNLDVQSEKTVFEYLRDLANKNKTVIIISHNPLIEEYVDTLYRMDEGKLARYQDAN